MCTPDEINSTMIRFYRFSDPSSLNNRGPIVKATSFIKKDATSDIIDLNKLSQTCMYTVNCVEIIESEGRLHSTNKRINANFWLKIVNLAVDCQTYNIILIPSEKGVVIKAIRDIAPDEILFLWFSENLLIILNMPFLTLKNIQRQDRYICDTCYTVYEHPNPLKIHMFLDCDRLDHDHLWNVLVREFASLQYLHHPRPFLFQLNGPINAISPDPIDTSNLHLYSNPSPTLSNQLSSSSSSQPSSISPQSLSSIYPNGHNISHRLSAFKPYGKAKKLRSVSNVCPSVANTTGLTLRSNLSTDPADIENYASNIGKSINGYICVYCSKVYSRKTHTGYKPLICSYCKRSFGDPSNLNKHVRLHRDSSNSPYKCDICGKVLVRKRDLERHIKTKHENNNRHTDISNEGLEF
ncbi:PREDICTED: PR domain zinc finger protein 13 [Polistes dominula]|uniref:PR domain zinc finger protein 13 n=1 Tax=Polistes dominula TaxID=743375 RepID=A0ABM1IEV2_POLDO|nr:PREDICTED: PR domain zinc finger protein 13 [Polistes dominula]